MAERRGVSAIRAAWARACRRMAWVSAVFCTLLAALVFYNNARLHSGAAKPKLRVVEGLELIPLKNQLREDPNNNELKERVRLLDRDLRAAYYRREALASRAGWALLGGALVLVLSLHGARSLGRPRLPCPVFPTRKPDPARQAALASTTVIAVSCGLAGLATPLALKSTRMWRSVETPAETAEEKPTAPVADDFPDAAETAANWGRFRGPNGDGVTSLTGLPESWDGPSGKNILWKTALDLPGKNSPVVWGRRIFTSGATETKREVYCHDAATGSELWRAEVGTPQSARAEPPEILEDTGYAAPTMATDGRRAFAIFANGDVAGFSMSGESLWVRSLGTPVSAYGHAASLALWRNVLIVLLDQGSADDGLSKLIGLEAASGKTLWETPRPVDNSWTSPLLIEVNGGPQVITSADPWVIAYHPENGAEIWRAELLEGDVAPPPVFANGMIYVACDRTCVAAIRPDGTGNVTESHVVWKQEDSALPDMCGMLCDGPRIYMLVFGSLYALDAMSGEELWEFDTEAKFEASPSWFDGKLHLLSTKGEWISGVADADGFTESGRQILGEKASASAAFMPGRIYLRGEKHLYCIGANEGE